jgi:hypothetical protein
VRVARARSHISPPSTDEWDDERLVEGRAEAAEIKQEHLCGGMTASRVNGRLKDARPNWARLAKMGLVSAFVLAVVSSGYDMERAWRAGPPPPCEMDNHASTDAHGSFVSDALQAALSSGAIACSSRQDLHCVLPLGVAEQKSTGKLRLIFDARFVNEFLAEWKFKMETLQKEGRHIFAGMRFGSILDISSAFHHIQMHHGSWKYLGFKFRGQYYHWRSLPFGLKTAPVVFSKVVQPIVGLWRRRGFRVLQYLDDFPGAAEDKASAKAQVTAMMEDMETYGFLVKAEKCLGVEEPLASFGALGFIIDLVSQEFRVDGAKLRAVAEIARSILADTTGRVLVKRVASIVGLIISMTLAIGAAARIRTRAMLRNLQERLRAGDDPCDKHTWKRHVRVLPAAREELQWWAEHAMDFENRGMPIASLHSTFVGDALLASDASATGFGGWMTVGCEETMRNSVVRNLLAKAPEGVRVHEVVRAARKGIEVAGAFTAWQAAKSSSWRELFGAARLLEALGPLLEGSRVHLRLDSQVATGALGGSVPEKAERDEWQKGLSRGGSRVEELQELVLEICDVCTRFRILLHAMWVPREHNMWADEISHYMEHDQHDYTLKHELVEAIERAWGIVHEVDRFASEENCRVRSGRFNSRFGTSAKGWEWADALTIDWGSGCINWIHPPYLLIDRVLDHAQQCRAKGTLIVPDWPTRSFWPRLFREKVAGGFERGQAIGMPCRPEVKRVMWLGPASALLYYPSKGSDFAERHMPRGNLLAVQVDFSE